MLDITTVFVTQRKLKRLDVLETLKKLIVDGTYIDPIEILQTDDGKLELHDGHHRLAAYYLCGRFQLEDWEYILLPMNSTRPRFGTVKGLIERTGIK